MIEFASPYYILLLIVIPILIVWYIIIGKSKEGTIQFSSTKLIGQHFKKRGKIRTIILHTLTYLILAFIILSLTRPRLVDNFEETKIEVVDIVMVLDISSSMLAEDFKPNRL